MKAISLHSNVGKPKTKNVCFNVNIKHVGMYVSVIVKKKTQVIILARYNVLSRTKGYIDIEQFSKCSVIPF